MSGAASSHRPHPFAGRQPADPGIDQPGTAQIHDMAADRRHSMNTGLLHPKTNSRFFWLTGLQYNKIISLEVESMGLLIADAHVRKRHASTKIKPRTT